jgi:hypothetical protein
LRSALVLFLVAWAGATPAAAPTPLSEPLVAQRPYSADEYRKLFLVMWAQVPNWKSGDPLWIKRAEPPYVPAKKGQPRVRRPPPHEPEKLDWLAALDAVNLDDLELPFALEGLPKVELPPVPLEHRVGLRDDAREVVRAMHALAATHRADAVEPLFRLAFMLDGVFRDECGRQIRAIGDDAVAPLVRLQYEKGTPAAPLAKQRRYAIYQLDRMDRARPSKAVDAAPDDRMRAELIRAYGEARAPDAVEAVLGQITAQSHGLRRAARAAFRRYVEGPPPPPAPKRKRRLPGGKEETEEKADYLTYREVAELALQKRVAQVGLTFSDPHPTPLAMFEALVAKDDAERAAEWERAFAGAQGRAEAGDLEGAVDAYEWILAHDPVSARRGEMVSAFATLAERRRATGRLDEAARLFWKAAVLVSADDAEGRWLQAEAAWTEAERARIAGRTDEQSLRRVLRLAPEHAAARTALARFERTRTVRRVRTTTLVLGIFAAVVWLAAWRLLRPKRV